MASVHDMVKMMLSAEKRKMGQKGEDTPDSITIAMDDGPAVVVTNSRNPKASWNQIRGELTRMSKAPASSTHSCHDVLKALVKWGAEKQASGAKARTSLEESAPTKQRNRQRPAETSTKPAQNSETGRDQQRPAETSTKPEQNSETGRDQESDQHKTSTKQRNRQRPAETSTKPAQNSITGRDQQRPRKTSTKQRNRQRPAETSTKPLKLRNSS